MKAKGIESVFNACFSQQYGVVLQGGAVEPMYHPDKLGKIAKIFYREDYVSSALHEVAHWCIAGPERRSMLDFGYSYCPPPRNYEEQQQFFSFEKKVQALEWVFSEAGKICFHPSADNLEATTKDFERDLFVEKLKACELLIRRPFLRAALFRAALAEHSAGEFMQEKGGASSYG